LSASSSYINIISQPQNNVKSQFVKTYPSLNLKALSLKVDKEYTIFTQLKYIDSNGSGLLLYKDALQNLKEQFNYSDSNARKLLENCNQLFLDITKCKTTRQRYIKLYNYYTVSENLGVEYLGHPISIDFSKCDTRLKKRAFLFGTFFKTPYHKNCNHPMSRLVIEKKSGINIRQQQRYSKEAPLEVMSNFTDEPIIYGSRNHIYATYRQLSNTCISLQANIGNKGNIKKINKRLKLWQKNNPSFHGDVAQESSKRQLYYDDIEKWKTFKNKQTEPLDYAPVLLQKYGVKYSIWSKCA